MLLIILYKSSIWIFDKSIRYLFTTGILLRIFSIIITVNVQKYLINNYNFETTTNIQYESVEIQIANVLPDLCLIKFRTLR